MKYHVKIRYVCPEIKEEPRWVIVDCEKPPELGVVKKDGPLPSHGCKKYHYSQLCEEDETCYWQNVLEVRKVEDLEGLICDESGFPIGK